AEGSNPIVVVGTTGDPATPYQWAVDFSKTLANAVLITWEGEGHTAYGRSTDCVNKPIDKYLLDGTVPEADLKCPAE
ncbi:alpha/beta hydrolase, partial [uncultured Arcanobacterium sp.]